MTLALRPVFHRSEWWPGAARRYRQLVEALAEVLVGVAGNPGVGMDLLAFQEPDDREFARAVLARAGLPSDAARLYEGPLDPVTARTLLQESELVVAMRLHAVILGAGVPMVGVAYDAKVEGALESLGLAGWSVPVGDGRLGADSALDAPALLALVRSAWRTRSQLRRKLEPAAREIRSHAQRGGRAVLARALGAAGPDMASELPRPWPLERAWRHRGSGPAPATSHVAADTQGGSGRATPAAQNYPDRLHALARLACAAGDADAALALWPNLLPALALRAGNLLAAEPTRDNDVESARALLSLAAADADMALHLLASVPATRAAGLTQALAAKPTGCDPEAQTRRAAGLLMHLVGGREVAAQRLEAMGRVHDARRIRLLQQLVQQSGGGAIVRLQRVRDRLHAIHEGLITRRGWAAIVRAACSNPDVTEELERDVLLLGRELLAGPPQPVAQEPAPSGAR